jgi:hypothetical protein
MGLGGRQAHCHTLREANNSSRFKRQSSSSSSSSSSSNCLLAFLSLWVQWRGLIL